MSRPIVFFGTPEFASHQLEALLPHVDVKAVVTAPDKPAGRGHKLQASAVKRMAEEKGIPILQPKNLKDSEFQAELASFEAQLFVVVAFRMLPESVWSMPSMGSINLHASLLPDYRGAAPIQRAIMNGERRSGVTTFKLQHEIDTGAILLQREVEISPDDNAGDLHDKLMHAGADVLMETCVGMFEGKLKATAQDRIDLGRELQHAPKIFREDCLIDWNRSSEGIHNQVRGLSPFPGAIAMLREGDDEVQIKVYASFTSDRAAEVGSILIDEDSLFVGCGTGSLRILELQKAGKKRMDTKSFLLGHPNLESCHFV